MQLSERFLNFLQQQLNSFDAEPAIKSVVVYIARPQEGSSPTLEAVGKWPNVSESLPPVEEDPQLRAPSPDRRWYPLQEGSILIGVLRAERCTSDEVWPESLDRHLQSTAFSIAQCLGLELDRDRLLDELKQQREQMSVMVHQLRNPLTALRTYAQLLLRKLDPESKQRDLVEGLLSEQAQLSRYISALDELNQSKLPSSNLSPAPLLLPPVLPSSGTLNLKSLLEPLIHRAAVTASLQSKNWSGPKDWPSWTINQRSSKEASIAEIVANLLENAFRYSPSNCDIGLYLNNRGICVWDSGLPIPLKERERIFEKGFRGQNKNNGQGSGIGLALGRRLAQEIGCELRLTIPPNDFDPSLPDKGNAFILLKPYKENLEK